MVCEAPKLSTARETDDAKHRNIKSELTRPLSVTYILQLMCTREQDTNTANLQTDFLLALFYGSSIEFQPVTRQRHLLHCKVSLYLFYICLWGEAHPSFILCVSVPNTVRRAEAESWSISDLTVQVYSPSSPSLTLGMVSDSFSFLCLRHKQRRHWWLSHSRVEGLQINSFEVDKSINP